MTRPNNKVSTTSQKRRRFNCLRHAKAQSSELNVDYSVWCVLDRHQSAVWSVGPPDTIISSDQIMLVLCLSRVDFGGKNGKGNRHRPRSGSPQQAAQGPPRVQASQPSVSPSSPRQVKLLWRATQRTNARQSIGGHVSPLALSEVYQISRQGWVCV